MDWQTSPSSRLVIDLGSLSLRMGPASSEMPALRWFNMIGNHKKSGDKIFGETLEQLLEEDQFLYAKPMTKGLLVNKDTENELLLKMFEKIGIDNHTSAFKSLSLTASCPPFCPVKVKQEIIELAFEYYSFAALSLVSSAQALYQRAKSTDGFLKDQRFAMIVESSHSSTHVTPFFDGNPVSFAAKRLDIGGRLLSNYLKDLISFKQMKLDNYPRLVNKIKETCCRVSLNYLDEMKKGPEKRLFRLPDPDINRPGYPVSLVLHCD